jgi:four helix bundle protein
VSCGYKKLSVWMKSDELVKFVYEVSRKFPKDEIYGLTSQLRRASLSVVVNIVEGYARGGKKELRRFLQISWGSLLETEYLIDFAFDQEYLCENEYHKLVSLKDECSKLLWRMRESV